MVIVLSPVSYSATDQASVYVATYSTHNHDTGNYIFNFMLIYSEMQLIIIIHLVFWILCNTYVCQFCSFLCHIPIMTTSN